MECRDSQHSRVVRQRLASQLVRLFQLLLAGVREIGPERLHVFFLQLPLDVAHGRHLRAVTVVPCPTTESTFTSSISIRTPCRPRLETECPACRTFSMLGMPGP